MSWIEDTIAQLQGGGAGTFSPAASPFPDYKPPPSQADILDAIQRNELENQKAAGGNQPPFGVPDMNSAGVRLAMNNAPAGTGVPGPLGDAPVTDAERQMMAMVGRPPAGMPAGAPDGSVFGGVPDLSKINQTTVPPSLEMAGKISAPPPAAAPPPSPADTLPPPGQVPMPRPRPDAAPGDGPTDVSAQSRQPAPGGPAGVPPAAPEQPSPFSRDRIADALAGFGAALQGDRGALANKISADREAKVLQAQQGNATARLLASKGASAPEIQAAISGGPDTIKALLGQYMGKDKYAVVKTGDYEDSDGNKRGIYSVFNSNDGKWQEIKADSSDDARAIASRTITGPDGKQIQIPDGVNRKEFIKKMSDHAADAAAGKMTETQAKASSFAARMVQAEGTLKSLQDQGLSLSGKVMSEIPGGNYLQSKNYQQYKQAASQFITAVLRQESGAAINKSEFERYEKEFFPQPGDDASVVTQKAAARAAAIDQMKRSAGPSYARSAAESASSASSNGPPKSDATAVKPGNYVWKNGALVPE